MRKIRDIAKSLFKSFAKICSLFPLKYIVFESLPDYSDNTRAVFDEMVKRGINNKYMFVWLSSNPNTAISVRGVKCIHNRALQILYIIRSKCLVSCNTFTYSFGNYQKSIYLCHGVPLKSLNGYTAPSGIDYIVGLSEDTNAIQSVELKIAIDKFLTLGYPRNDSLFAKKRTDIDELFEYKYKKIIVWYPTFRQHGTSHIKSATANALPIIHNVENAKRINEIAQNLNVLIVLKPHFSQDTSYIRELELSNIAFIDDMFFQLKGITSYEFVGGCDALVTDYSSIYFDYLLCDKPVAAVWEDIEEYKRNRGFAIDIDFYMKGAYKIYNAEDFISFMIDLANGTDTLSNERAEIRDVAHRFKDPFSTKRVVDFIEKEILK